MELRVDRGERRQPLAVLPRYRKDENGNPITPTLILDVELAKGVAGCAVCDKPITKGTSRLKLDVKLDVPLDDKRGRARTHETFFMHPGCITDRIKPEVIRHGFDCYDCGAIPEEGLRWAAYAFTVSRFSPAPICTICAQKPKWVRCQVCNIFYPPWMLQTVDGPVPTDDDGMSFMNLGAVDLNVEHTCEYCARRHGIRTVEAVESELEKFERLKAEIAEHGIFEAGS